MAKKNELKTPRSQVRSALRRLFLRSREHSYALRRDNYTCQECQRKQSKAKGRELSVQVHHIDAIGNWEALIDAVYEYLLCHPDFLQTVCEECHQKNHKECGHEQEKTVKDSARKNK